MPEAGKPIEITSENQSKPLAAAKPEIAKMERGMPVPLITVRHMILQFLMQRNQPTYASMVAGELAQYGITKERILIELNKLTNSPSRPVRRNKSPFNRRYLYLITESGINEVKKKTDSLKGNNMGMESPPLDPYLWLLENLLEPRTIEDLVELRGDSEITLRVYLSQLYKLGAIEKRKEPEEKQISQRNRNGQIMTRTTTVFKTYYCMKDGPLKAKMAENPELNVLGKSVQTIKVEVPVPNPGVKEPAFTEEEEKLYLEWRESIRDVEAFNQAILKRANKAGIRPLTAYKLVFKQLRDSGKI